MTRRDFNLDLYAKRTNIQTVKLYKPDKTTPAILAVDDHLRFKLRTNDENQTIVLDVDSVGASANGSTISITDRGDGTDPAAADITIGQGDLDLTPGTYVGELSYVDNSMTNPADADRMIMQGLVTLHGTASGDLGLTA